MMAKKTTKGRQRIDIVKMKNDNNLQVTFSKRRAGLFKKASELCTLTGSEVAVVVFSPGEKAYSFGCPSVNEIIQRFESQTPHLINPPNMVVDARRRANVLNLNKELGTIEGQLEDEKHRSDDLSQMVRGNSTRSWWEAPFDELNLEQLEVLRLALEDLQKNVKLQAQKILPETAHPLPDFPGSRNGCGARAASVNILRPSATSAFFPYDCKPTPTVPTVPFTSLYVGPSLTNNSISVKNGPSFDAGENGCGPSTPFDLNASAFGGFGMPPYPYEFFSKGYGGGSL